MKLQAVLVLLSFIFSKCLSIGVVRAETVNMGYDAARPLHAPKVVDGVNFLYDRNGNLENDGERVLSWNVDNLPVKIVKDGVETSFFYDADGRRVVKQVGQDMTNRTVYVNQYYQEPSTKFYFAGDRRLATSDGNFYHQDYLGSTILATDANSQPISKALSYFPYGSLTSESMSQRVSGSRKYLFTGQELDPESSLYNYNARLYNPKTGVFVSADTAGGTFAYAAGNPLLYTDPTGHYNEIGAGGGGSQDANDALQITISGGGYQPPTIGATGAINDANVVYTPQNVDMRAFGTLMGTMVGFSLAAPVIVLVGTPGAALTGAFITLDARNAGMSLGSPSEGTATKLLKLGMLAWDLIPIVGTVRHGASAGRVAAELAQGASTARELTERAISAGLVDEVVSAPGYATKAQGYFRVVEGGTREMYVGSKMGVETAGHELTHAVQYNRGLIQLTEMSASSTRSAGRNMLTSLGNYMFNPSFRAAEWEANVFFGGTNYLLLPLSTPFGWNSAVGAVTSAGP